MNTVMVQFNKRVIWDNWGQFVTAFKKGDIVQAEIYDDGLGSAESPYWKGIEDTIYPDDFDIIG